jgi:hypothetical protein
MNDANSESGLLVLVEFEVDPRVQDAKSVGDRWMSFRGPLTRDHSRLSARGLACWEKDQTRHGQDLKRSHGNPPLVLSVKVAERPG